MSKRGTKKWCLVSNCRNSSQTTPNKHFFHVPCANRERRVQWLQAIGRDPSTISHKSNNIFVCEDHFNLPSDTLNYVQHKTSPDLFPTLKLKHNVVPNVALDVGSSSSFTNITTDSSRTLSPTAMEVPSGTSTASQKSKKQSTHFRSKAIQCSLTLPESQNNPISQTILKSPLKLGQHSPSKIVHFEDYSHHPLARSPIVSATESSSPTKSTQSSGSLFEPSEDGSSEMEEDRIDFKNSCRDIKLKIIREDPKHYIGIPAERFERIIKLLSKFAAVGEDQVIITLYKIKTNLSFKTVGDDFGYSESAISRIFSHTVPILAKLLRKFIYWPSKETILSNLPVAFVDGYSNVQSIIDCLEIEIEKPSDIKKQALTYSKYKTGNTLKYLISSTPDGHINFVSNGFGGRTKDTLVFKESGFLNCLPAGVDVMADRGFKFIEESLSENKCSLVRPPSVSTGKKLSEEEGRESRRIAGLRVHIERVIRRVREFKMAAPHATINYSLIGFYDEIMTIICALCNIQNPLIKY